MKIDNKQMVYETLVLRSTIINTATVQNFEVKSGQNLGKLCTEMDY
jgi:hypothetical protein